MTEKSRISVIVPVYNKEKLLPRLLDSLLAQTYGDMEFIIVDDGSADGSAAIIDRYAEKDDRIITIHKENGGLVSARNAGLDRMTGEFFGFVDGDDYVEPDMFERLHAAIIGERCDIAECGFRIVTPDGAELERRHTGFGQRELTRDEALAGLLSSGAKKGLLARLRNRDAFLVSELVWDKLYRSDVLCDLRFDEKTSGGPEDLWYVTEALLRVRKVCVIDDVAYNFVEDDASLTRQQPADEQETLRKDLVRAKATLYAYDNYLQALAGLGCVAANDAANSLFVIYAHMLLNALRLNRLAGAEELPTGHIKDQMKKISGKYGIYLPERVLCFLATHFPRLAEAALGAAWKMRG